MSRQRKIRGLKKQRGLATVELALTTPFILVTLLLAAEFSRVFYEFNTLTKSVRDAARYAAEGSYDGAKVFQLDGSKITRATNLVVYGNTAGVGSPLLTGLTGSDVSITQLDIGGGAEIREHIEVEARYDFQPLAPVISGLGFLPGDVGMNFELVASSTMRAL